MTIKVIRGNIIHNGIRYLIGEHITGLSQDDEARLISLGVAEKYPDLEEQKNITKVDNSREDAIPSKVDESHDEDATTDNEKIDIKFNPDEYVQSSNNVKKAGK